MSSCGCKSNHKFDGMDPKYKKALWIVIAINGAMFLIEMIGGIGAKSQALQADALDFLGDTLTYGISLLVIGMPLKTRSTAALAKGVSLLLMGFWVLFSTFYQFFILQTPFAPIMGSIAILALAANVASVLFLLPYKDGDANVRSVWLCSKNDALSNVFVIAASFAVYFTASAWPDLLVAMIMAFIFTRSAIQILQQAWQEYHSTKEEAADHAHDHEGHKHACHEHENCDGHHLSHAGHKH